MSPRSDFSKLDKIAFLRRYELRPKKKLTNITEITTICMSSLAARGGAVG